MPDTIISDFVEKISLPEQDLARLEFCRSNKVAGVRAWTGKLRTTQVNQTSAQIYKALPDILRLKTDVKNRLEMLECVRLFALNAVHGLSREFLNQPLDMPEKAQKAALIAQTMHKYLADGYCLCVRDNILLKRFKPPQIPVTAMAIQRAMDAVSRLIMRNLQLYTQTPAQLWQRLHLLYMVAEHFELLNESVPRSDEPGSKTTTVKHTYIAVLMLATARANQLSQQDVERLFDELLGWSHWVKLRVLSNEDLCAENDTYIWFVDLAGQSGPCYKSHLPDAGGHAVAIDFSTLLSLVSNRPDADVETIQSVRTFEMPKLFPHVLVQHLRQSWGKVVQRQLERNAVTGEVDVAVGLSDSHHFLAGSLSFPAFLEQQGLDSQLIATSSFGRTSLGMGDLDSERPLHRVQLRDISQGGCKLLWSGAAGARVQAGELLCLKGVANASWSIGVVRWIRKLKNGAQLGVKILSSQPRPKAVARVHGSDMSAGMMRALFLPRNQYESESDSLITASVRFKEGDMVELYDGGRSSRVVLGDCLFANTNVREFSIGHAPTNEVL